MFRTYVAVLACAALSIGGCGGGEDSSSAGDSGQTTAAQTRLTHGEYVAQANKIGKDAAAAEQEYVDRANKMKRADLKARAPFIADAVKVTRVSYDQIKALSPPAADKAQVDAYLTTIDRRLDLLARAAEAARVGDRAAAKKAVAESNGLDDAQDPLVRQLGLEECRRTF
jgi:hypothetical protein